MSDDLLVAAKGLASVMRHTGQGYAETAERVMAYDSTPYPLTYVFMSTTVAAFLRALAAADGVETAPASPAFPRPRYGPPLRESE